MSNTIQSPIEGHSGTTYIGATVLAFRDGIAYKADVSGAATDEVYDAADLNDGARIYLAQAGYTVGGETVDVPASIDGNPVADPTPVDSRDLADATVVGEPLRDAAVDPEPGDFLEPTNAGKADPHGPEVVSPEIHASQGVRPVKGGEVHVDDTAVQDKVETAHAASAVDGTPVEPLPSEAKTTAAAEQLKGDALDSALKAAGLSTSGTADEKRARLAEHQAKA